MSTRVSGSAVENQIAAIEKEIRETPYDKSTERHHGLLRARIARLKERQLTQASSKSGGGGGYAIKKQGDATVVLVGPPSVGKSTLLNLLTNAESKVAPYAFTTVTVIPGMLVHKGAYIQILDVPGLIQGAKQGRGRGKEVLSVIRGADLVIIMSEPKRIKDFDSITEELEGAGIRLNKRPPDVTVTKALGGGITIKSNIKQELDKQTIREVAWEFGVKNGEISIREKLTMQTLVDSFASNRVYIPCIYVLNKADLLKKTTNKDYLKISAEQKSGIDELKKVIWDTLGLATVYLVRPEDEPSMENPIIMKRDNTLADVAQKIGSEFAENKTGAKIWGEGSKFAGQEVSLKTKVQEGMMVRFS